jgi:two-component system phosphate regulon sensor histidine kinase PhoR
MEDNDSGGAGALDLVELNARLKERERELMEANLSCQTRAQELAEVNARLKEREQELVEANRACEFRAEELAELNARLEQLDQARSQFIYLVTHELRAPVAAIQSYLKLILEGYVPAEKQREIIQKAEQRALDQLALISDLLDLARLEQPRAEVDIERVDLAQSLREVCDLLRAQAQERDIAVSVQIDPEVPPLLANAEHVRQLWTNLVSNAIKYTMPGGEVSVTLSHENNGILGRVDDTGIGIAPEDLPRVFNEFYRAENAKAVERHGTGLGLSIAKGIVDTYGGRISVESQVGEGSTFVFFLPATGGS